MLDRILLLDGVSRGYYTRSKMCVARLGVCRIGPNNSSEICFGDIAKPDTGVATHTLPGDDGDNSTEVKEH